MEPEESPGGASGSGVRLRSLSSNKSNSSVQAPVSETADGDDWSSDDANATKRSEQVALLLSLEESEERADAGYPTKPKTLEKLSHIGHLNGLRALAFMGVFLFHFRYGCPGGFLGVDIFFALSGYLMSRSIGFQVAKGSFSYTSFLVRRFWRLYPALLCTIIATTVATYGFFSVDYTIAMCKSAIASVLALSNIQFLSEENYFGTASVMKPLLHTWSLSVEWQFYLIWPLLMAFGYKFRERAKAWMPLSAICVASFTYGIQLAAKNPEAAFFTLPSRAFEFGLGAFVWGSMNTVSSAVLANTLSLTGTLFIVLSFTFLNADHGPPALIALPSLIGACMIIVSSSNATANRFYRSHALDYLGKISYSAYLVHWPVFVFYNNIYEHENAPGFVAAAVVSMCLLVSALMYHSVEDEYRVPRTWHHKLVGLLLFMLAVTIPGHGLYTQGWKEREDDSKKRAFSNGVYLGELKNIYNPFERKLPGSKHSTFYGIIPNSTTKSVNAGDYFDAVVLGDSFAGPMAGLMQSIARRKNKTFLLSSYHSCAPFFDDASMAQTVIDYPNPKNNPRAVLCKGQFRPEMFELARVTNSNIVILAGNWVSTSQMWDAYRKSVANEITEKNKKPLARSALEETVAKLNDIGKKVLVVGMVPGAHYNVRECLAATGPLAWMKKCPPTSNFKGSRSGGTSSTQMLRRATIRDTFEGLLEKEEFSKALAAGKLAFTDPYKDYCNLKSGNCVTASVKSTQPLYSDDFHLTANGSLLMEESVWSAFQHLSQSH